jgi:DNA modification methylase
MNLPNQPYADFLKAKIKTARDTGFEVSAEEMNPALKPFTLASVQWALRGGRRAIFSRFGLHKTVTQLEIMRLIGPRRPGVRRLIVAPLDVIQEFMDDTAQYFVGVFAIDLRFVQSNAEIETIEVSLSADAPAPIFITNYESVREGKLDAASYVVSLDEASVLRGFGGTKTFREFMRLFEHSELERFVATATPSPNEYIELLAYSAFLGIMDVGQAKTRFFRRNSEKADDLTIRPGAEREFWLWVASWALFIQAPSDLGYSDEGYVQPDLDVHWHEVPTDHKGAGAEKDGQARMFRNAAIGVVDASREKRDSLGARIGKMMELRAMDPGAHRVVWHDLEAERAALEKAIPSAVSVYGNQRDEDRQRAKSDFKHGRIAELLAKPSMLGSGCNFQHHCHWAIYLGIGFKFNDFWQSIHRLQRFGQAKTVRVDLIYTSAEREVRRKLEKKWRQHEAQAAIMSGIIREFGLSNAAMALALYRSFGIEREEASGDGWTMVLNDSVRELATMETNSIDLIVTSIPFGTQYEYSANYADFGHTEDNEHFFAQMGYLLPDLLRVLKPGRNACIHVKDRVTPGGINGYGFQTVTRFSDQTCDAFEEAGFAFLARVTIATDVVRENAQTYRLGWSEQCKDGSRMGNGMPEYMLIFRKVQTDTSSGRADDPVVKPKPLTYAEGWAGEATPFVRGKKPVPGTGYSRARWQFDANGLYMSDGECPTRPLPKEFIDVIRAVRADGEQKKAPIYRVWKKWSLEHRYSFDLHVAFAEELDRHGLLPPDFMLIPPHSDHPDVWTDIARMRSLNMIQQQKGLDQHLCPLPFDIVDRVIIQRSMPGEMVLDPFGGIGTVAYCAKKLGRRSYTIELSRKYFSDGLVHMRSLDHEGAQTDMFAAAAE